MKFNEYYDFFFDNHGKCPTCKKHMVMHVGCVNWMCQACRKHKKEVKEFYLMNEIYSKRVRKIRLKIALDKIIKKDRVQKWLIANPDKRKF